MKAIPKILLPILLLIGVTQSAAELCNPQDKQALLQIKQAFGNPYYLASWTADTDCCDWYVVACDLVSNRIISLTMFSGDGDDDFSIDLSGEIPPQIGNLPFLQMLDLNNLNLTGPIQPTIANLKNLNFLRLQKLKLSGPVPGFLGQLTNLYFLDVSYNSLTGTIPSSLSSLNNLGALHLDHNEITGPIPDSFGSFQEKTMDLYLSNNQLTGKIPVSLGNVDFNAIDLSYNNLAGDASFLFGSSKTTENIVISWNSLAFDFSNVVFPKSLKNLDISHNNISGGIPQEITQLNLQLDVSYNKLCGQIPQGGKLQSFASSSYDHNSCLCDAPLQSCK